ncbi:hypothetical protein RHGRI_013747 [Rhododendron griersonianum]|uniref:Secreted protein n=1 Tax=Rhododendron griersonianum TaxID=479676 RepID=A0AAV6K730_9ERIC|nr:hypothetical protein RHGRI_013747 [Rhododendron griersonianum]
MLRTRLSTHAWCSTVYGCFLLTSWSDSKSTQPFFYWLDVGDGKELNLECCHIIDLHSQCIKCLGPLRSTVPFSNSSKGC